MATTHAAVVGVEQYKFRRLVPVFLLGCAGLAGAMGVSEQVSSKVDEIRLQSALIHTGQAAIGGFLQEAQPPTDHQRTEISRYQSAIEDARHRRDSNWHVAGILASAAAIGAAAGSITRTQELAIPTIPALTT